MFKVKVKIPESAVRGNVKLAKIAYRLNGKLHREDGPAIEYRNGDKVWYKNGLKHREDGPAIEREDGSEEWWVNGDKSDINGNLEEKTGKSFEEWLKKKKINV